MTASLAACARAPFDRWWLVTRKYPPRIGGMERLSYEMTTRIAARRASAAVLVMRAPRWAWPLLLAATAGRLLHGCVRRDVALLHVGDPVLAPLAFLARAFGVPTVVTLHGLDVVHAAPAYRLWRRLFLRGFDAYVCISDATRRAALAAGLPAGRLQVIGVGVDAPPPAPGPVARDANRMLFVGRLVQRKGLAWFVREVLPALAATRPDLRLVVLGDGPERRSVSAAARAAGVDDRLLWPEVRDDVQKAEWFARAALCVMPNVAVPGDLEGFGIVALEAAAAGCPLIAADIEGLRDATAGGRAGTLVRSGDARAWIRTIDERLADASLNRRAGDEARDYVRRHCGWDAIADAYERLFATLASGNGRRSSP